MSAINNPRPVPPVQPDLDECCNSGCNPCIFDVYEDALEHYRAALKTWEEKAAASKPDRPGRTKKIAKKLGSS